MSTTFPPRCGYETHAGLVHRLPRGHQTLSAARYLQPDSLRVSEKAPFWMPKETNEANKQGRYERGSWPYYSEQGRYERKRNR